MIGSRNCSLTGIQLLSDYNFVDQLEKNTAFYAPILLE